ncbi:hypothetical protein [Elizabethkingia sp. JS20170427COW]|uniref:hypothetical protein n=1 Tax=Elizabethkingia sp. JS20170427COW TaxID=2583851 RepID=UPI0011102646|nr:hypothetical protein [Elizabethkingia sp. JS20170427COW]QCX53119.1 hypothetical protein FGE20_04935 [Elizabethkingia sp. JS20170427COW]
MQNPLDLSSKTLEEVKKIALEISNTHTTVGLIANFQKIQKLYEKSLFLKMLNEENIDLHQRKEEIHAIKEVNPTHSNTAEALEKEKEVEAEYDEVLENDEIASEIMTLDHAEIKAEEELKESHQEENTTSEEVESNEEGSEKLSFSFQKVEEVEKEQEILGTKEQLEEQINEEPIAEDSEEKESELHEEEYTSSEINAEFASLENQELSEEELSQISQNKEDAQEVISEKVEAQSEQVEKPHATTLFSDEEVLNKETHSILKEINESTDEHKVKLSSIKGLSHSQTDSPRSEMAQVVENPLPKIRLDLNDRMAFVKRLFANNGKELEYTIEKLNAFNNLEDAKEYLSEMYYRRNWENQDNYAQRLWALVEARFR